MEGNISILYKNWQGQCGSGKTYGRDGVTYYFTKNALLNCNIRQLSEGDSVEFRASSNERGPLAVDIRSRTSADNETVNPGINSNVKLDHFIDVAAFIDVPGDEACAPLYAASVAYVSPVGLSGVAHRGQSHSHNVAAAGVGTVEDTVPEAGVCL